jgi:hypothetical protein
MRSSLTAIALTSAALIAGALIASPTVAGATVPPEWVGTAPAVEGGGSCASPGFNSVQAAVNAAASGATIHVCAGTYVEQVQITKSVKLVGEGTPILRLPAAPADSTTSCDTAINSEAFQPNQDEVSICGAIVVHISGVVVDAAWPANTCYDSMYGVFVGGGAKLVANKLSVVAAGAVPLNGCQGGIGIQVGTTRTSPAETGHLVMTASAVTGYQKNGINVVGAGTVADIGGTSVVGDGPQTSIAQNGIEVFAGAKASIHNDTISGNECNVAVCGPDSLTQTQSAGVLLLDAAKNTIVNNSDITSNDIGVYYVDDVAPAPTAPTNSIKGNTFANDRYEGVCLDQGAALLAGNTYSDGNVGILALQYDGQTFGGLHVAHREKISGESVAAVQVLSDQAPGDVPGSLTVTNSTFHGGATLDNSDNYALILNGDH